MVKYDPITQYPLWLLGDVPDVSKPPPTVPQTESLIKSALSLDAYESDILKRKNAKKHECLQQRRKLGYDKAARENLLMELKLKNQLLWKCAECTITCGKAGMEKHITSKMHWDKVLENYIKSLDAEQPPLNR